jgi:hypothetical protein
MLPGEKSVSHVDIWAYLNSIPSGAASQAMLAGWVAAGRIGSPDSPQWKRRIALLTSTIAADKDLNSDIISYNYRFWREGQEDVSGNPSSR